MNSCSAALARWGSEPRARPHAAKNSSTGQAKPGNYLVYQGFLEFNTAAIPAGATITSAVLKIKDAGDSSTTDFIINVYDKDYGTLATADFIANGSTAGLTLRCHYDTASGWTGTTYKTFVNDALAAAIVKGGTTRLVMMSSRQTGNNTPTGNEFVYWEATSAGSEATLTVTWTVPTRLDPMGRNGYYGA